MKYLILLTLFFPLLINAQTKASSTIEKQEVLRYAEQMPVAEYDVHAYIYEHMVYPEAAKANKEQGRIITDFVVTAEGGFTNITVRNSGRYPNVAKELIRVIQGMPKWKPATQGGKPVNVAYTLSIVVRAPGK